MRFEGPVKWRFFGKGADRYADLARKLIGGLMARLKHANKTLTGSRAVKTPDGTIIRVIFDGAIPIAEITPSLRAQEEEIPICAIYMESGLLDVATGLLHFGDTTECTDGGLFTLELWDVGGAPKFVARGCKRNVDSDPFIATATAAVADDPVLECTAIEKKNAQVALPASMWTGLTRRWVQAMYGTPTARYKLAPIEAGSPDLRTYVLTIPYADGVDEGDIARFGYMEIDWTFATGDYRSTQWALIDLGGYDFAFAEFDGISIKLHDCILTECGAKFIAGLKRASMTEEKKRMALSFALSGALPGKEVLFTLTIDELEDTFAFDLSDYRNLHFAWYGWKQNETGNVMAGVVLDHRNDVADGKGTSYLVTLTFDRSTITGNPTVSVSVGGTNRFWQASDRGVGGAALPSPPSLAMFGSADLYDTGGTPDRTIDFDSPLYCWFELDTLVVASFKLETTSDEDGAEVGCDTGSGDEWKTPTSRANKYCPDEVEDGCGPECDIAIAQGIKIVSAGWYLSYYSGVTVSERYYDNVVGGDTFTGSQKLKSLHTFEFDDEDIDSTDSDLGAQDCSDDNFNEFLGGLYWAYTNSCSDFEPDDSVHLEDNVSGGSGVVCDPDFDDPDLHLYLNNTYYTPQYEVRAAESHRSRIDYSSIVIPQRSASGAYFGYKTLANDSISAQRARFTTNGHDSHPYLISGKMTWEFSGVCYGSADLSGCPEGTEIAVVFYTVGAAMTGEHFSPFDHGDRFGPSSTLSGAIDINVFSMSYTATINGVASNVSSLADRRHVIWSNTSNIADCTPECHPYEVDIDTSTVTYSGDDPQDGVGTGHVARMFVSSGQAVLVQTTFLPSPTGTFSSDLDFGSYANVDADAGDFIPSFIGFA